MSFHITQERPKPKLWLAKPNKQIIQRLNGIENLNGKFNFMNRNEITFDINSHIFDEITQEQKKNPAIQKLKNKYLIKFTYNEQTEWFVINDKSNLAQEKDYISVVAQYIGSELDGKRIGDIEEIGVTIQSLFNKFLPTSALNWKVRYIDPKLAKIKREYNLSDASVSSLIEAVCTQTDAVVVFHNYERELSFIHRDNAGKFKGLKVKESTYLKAFNDRHDSKDLITRLYLMGKDGLTINGINPAGTSYIEDFSYYMKPFKRDSNRKVISHSDYMSDELCHALLDYQEYFDNRKGDYEDLSEDYNNLLAEQLKEDLKLSEISSILTRLEDRIEILKPRGSYVEKSIYGNTAFNMGYNTYYMMVIQNRGSLARVTVNGESQLISPNEYAYIKLKTPTQVDVGEDVLSYPVDVVASNPNLVVGLSTSSEADFREEDINELDKKYNVYKYRALYAAQYAIVTAVEKRVELYNQNRQNINESLSVQSFFTPQLLEERENFLNDGVWREENHTDPKELLEDGMKQLKEKNNVVRTTQVDIIDFVQSLAEEDQKNWDKLRAGDKIRFSTETYESDMEAFISDLDINFDDNEISLTLSDVIDLRDKAAGVANQLASFMSTSNQIHLQKNQIDENAGKTNQVIALLEAEWDANKRRILAGNETVDIGSHGIKITSPTHPNEMLMAVAGVIAISNDYGETFKQAINTRGVVAERLIGKVLIGTELVMENNSGTFRFDDEGVRINASSFHLIADDGEDYFENLMNQLEQEFVTYEERIKDDIKNQKESFNKEIEDVSESLTKYTNSMLDALADGMLTKQEIHGLKLELNMLEADYSQVRRRVIPMLQNVDLDPQIMSDVSHLYNNFEWDYAALVNFIMQLNEPEKVDNETLVEVKALIARFKPSIENLIGMVELALIDTQNNRIANAEYNSRTFAENLMHDLEDEVSDLTDALSGFDLSFKGALADGVLDMIERSQISDALMRMESEKRDVDNRYNILITHKHLKNTSELTLLQNSKREYDNSFTALVNQINYILGRDKTTVQMIEDYKAKYADVGTKIVSYSAQYEQTLEFVQNKYADTKLGEAQEYADGIQMEVSADIEDVRANVADFAEDVYGAFADGIITERERARLQIHHDMLEKEKTDVIERYNTIITNQYLQGFFDTEKLVKARADYGEVHADLLLSLELAMMDNLITKEEADNAVRMFSDYVNKLAAFSVQLELAIAAIGESKAVYQTQEELKNYISQSVFNDAVAQMQASLDGHIMTWYYDYKPAMTNAPTKDWATEKEKDNHIGDLFYHQTEGTAYRFMKTNGVYKWELIKDTEVTKALKDAQDAIDLADSKRRVFVATPRAPYDIGDLWIMDDGELMRARKARGENEEYTYIDWIVATKYTDDTKANAVANQLADFQKMVDTEFEDLSGALTAFKQTIEGVFKDGLVEEYELKILKTQQQSLDREKADVDALYNELLKRGDLTSIQRSTLVSRYTTFNTTHQTLKTTIDRVIEDGKITDKEYEDVMTALNNYPVELTKIKTYLNEVIQALITKALSAADDAMNVAKRFDTWKSSSFETDVDKIATRVGESSWEEKYLPVVKENISGIGSENLIPYSHIVNYIDQWDTVEQGTDRQVTLIAPSSGNAAYDTTARIYSSSVLSEQYFGVRSKPFVKDVIEGQTYTLSFKTTNHAASYTDMRYTYLMREASGSNQGSLNLKTTEIKRADDVLAYHHTVTFKANFSGKASIMIATRSMSNVAAQFHLYEPMFVQGSAVPQWTSSPNDQIQDFYNTEIKSNYSTTTQTKELLGSYVTSTEMQGNLDKIATYASSYDVGYGAGAILKEASGNNFDDGFSYELTAHTPLIAGSLVVAILNSKGKGKGWDLEILEEKGTTGSHPRLYMSGSFPAVTKWATGAKSEVQVVYTKYAGSFTNLNQTNSMIEQKAGEINSRVNQLQSGGSNLVPDSDFSIYSTPPSSWSAYGSDSYLNSSIRFGKVLLIQTYNPRRTDGITFGATTAPLTYDVRAGETYTLSFSANTGISASNLNYCYLMNTDGTVRTNGTKNNMSIPAPTIIGDADVNGSGNVFKRYKITFEADWSGRAHILIGSYIPSDAYTYIYLADVQVEKGAEASIYSPSTLDEYNRYSEIKQTAEGISTEVSKKVGNNEIISKINQSAEKVSINADKISLTAGSSIDLAIQNTAHPNPNLIPMSNFWSYPTEDFYYNYALSVVNESQSGLFTSPTFGRGWVKMMNSTLDTDSGLTYMWTQNGGRNRFSITAGQEYTFSILVAQNYNGNDLNYCYIREVTDGTSQINLATASGVKRTKFLVGRTYGRPVYKYIFTFTPNFGGKNTYMFFGMSNRAESRAGYYLSEWKLEAGDQASPYNENYASKDHIISAINADTSGVKISGDRVSISAGDIAIDGKTINISANSSITSLKTSVGNAQSTASTALSDASDADSRARAARTQADAARVGNNIAASLNLSGTTTTISGSKIDLVGDVSMVNGNVKVRQLSATSGANTLTMNGTTLTMDGNTGTLSMGNSGIVYRNSGGSIRYEMNENFVKSSTFGTTTANIYMAASSGYEVRFVDIRDVPGGGTVDDYRYIDARMARLYTSGIANNTRYQTDLRLGADGVVKIMNNGLTTLGTLETGGIKTDFVDLGASSSSPNLYLRPQGNSEVRITARGTTTSYVDVRARALMVNSVYSNTSSYLYLRVDEEVRVAAHASGSFRPIQASKFIEASSEKFKHSIEEWDYSVLDILKNETKVYKYKLNNDKSGLDNHGLIVERETPIEWRYKDGINTYEMNTWILKGVQELGHENDELKAKNKELENRLEKLEQILLK